MTQNQMTMLVLAAAGAVALYLLLRASAPASATRTFVPLTNYQNEESWTLERDPRSGRLTGITIHRDARAGMA